MYAVEVYASVRQFVFVQGRSQREAARVFGLSRETIGKICRFSLPARRLTGCERSDNQDENRLLGCR